MTMRDPHTLLAAAKERMNGFLDLLRQAVELESPTYGDKQASDACCRFFQKLYEELGFTVKVIHQPDCGNQCIAEYGDGPESLFLVGHYDTVFPMGTLKTMPWRVEDGKAHGPGALDMKGGFIQCWQALAILRDLGIAPRKKLRVFFNSDEEAGSPSSHERIMAEARNSVYSLILEPGLKNLGDVKSSRSGRAVYKIIAHGRAAHSGIEPQNAASAILELAHIVPALDALNNPGLNTTVSPTFVTAGIDNTATIPGEGRLTVDIRSTTAEELTRVCTAIEGLQPAVPGVRLEILGGLEKAPLEHTEPNRALFLRANALARELGFELTGHAIGGGSDGNFTAMAGAVTMDGLGLTGEFSHNEKEYVLLDHIPFRVALLARLIQTL